MDAEGRPRMDDSETAGKHLVLGSQGIETVMEACHCSMSSEDNCSPCRRCGTFTVLVNHQARCQWACPGLQGFLGVNPVDAPVLEFCEPDPAWLFRHPVQTLDRGHSQVGSGRVDEDRILLSCALRCLPCQSSHGSSLQILGPGSCNCSSLRSVPSSRSMEIRHETATAVLSAGRSRPAKRGK